jgi:uncharacterized protein
MPQQRSSAVTARAVIDGFEFATVGATQQGAFPLGTFGRLRDLLASDSGEAVYEVHGVHDSRGRPSLRLRVKATLQLRCQRCLEALPLEVDTESLLVLAASQAEIDADSSGPDEPDRVLAGQEMSVAALVEDELILAMPYAPRHEGCEPVAGREAQGIEAHASPFAGLKGLLRKH